MEPQTTDVIVVGAGVAGLAAADALTRAGFQTLNLEGRDRIGGRIHTIHTDSMPVSVELGAEFIHGRPAETWDIVNHEMFPVVEVDGDNYCFDRRNLKQCNDFWSHWERVAGSIRLENGADEPFLPFLKRLAEREKLPREVAAHAVEFVEGFDAAPPSQISLQSLIIDRDAWEQIEGDRAFHLLEGYDRVVNSMATGLDIRCSTMVKELHWEPGQVAVRAVHATSGDSQEFVAKAAVVTLPLGILQANGGSNFVQFFPSIPETIESARALKMGNVVKAILCFDEPFWIERGLEKLAFLHVQNQPFPVFWTTAPLITPVLTAWAGGPAADALTGLSERHILSSALKSLAACFDTSVEKLWTHLERSFVADWHSDPFSGGAYSYVPAGHAEARQVLAQPVSNTLFFAGEATHTGGFSGTVHGAIATGRRAAREASEALRNNRHLA